MGQLGGRAQRLPHTSRMGAVVKNDAYGLGVAQVVPVCGSWGAVTFGSPPPMRRLPCGPACPPSRNLRADALGAQRPGRLRSARLHAHGLVPALGGPHELAALAGYAARHGVRMPVAVHLDTGLTRLGFGEDDLGMLLAESALWHDARPALWLTHLGRFHDPDAPACASADVSSGGAARLPRSSAQRRPRRPAPSLARHGNSTMCGWAAPFGACPPACRPMCRCRWRGWTCPCCGWRMFPPEQSGLCGQPRHRAAPPHCHRGLGLW